jgi:hypothetical protein
VSSIVEDVMHGGHDETTPITLGLGADATTSPAEPDPELDALFPQSILKQLRGSTVVFIAYNLTVGAGQQGIDYAAHIGGLAAGLAAGFTIGRNLAAAKPSPLKIVAFIAAAAILIGVASPPLHVADVLAEMERLASDENKFVDRYNRAVEQSKAGHLTAREFADVIDREIVPQVVTSRARLRALEGVSRNQRPVVAMLGEHLRLKEEGFRLTAEGLREDDAEKVKQGGKKSAEGDEIVREFMARRR